MSAFTFGFVTANLIKLQNEIKLDADSTIQTEPALSLWGFEDNANQFKVKIIIIILNYFFKFVGIFLRKSIKKL